MEVCNPAVPTNTVPLFVMVTDFLPQYNPDFGNDSLPAALADPGIVADGLDADGSPTYGPSSGNTPTTTGVYAV